MSEIRLESVVKRFKETVAVDDLSLTVRDGEFFSLLGPSGCGKTTTLRMIGGFEEPTAGRVFLGGTDVTDLAPNKRDVNTVFQSYALFPHLDVYENVAFGLKRKKVPSDDIESRVMEMLRLVRMEGFERRKIDQLSGGQQQRVALARALVNKPQVLLLDEPLGALDLKLRKEMQLELKRIQSDVGITFIYVTHDQDEAMTMSDRIAVMNAGRIEQLDSPEKVYELPRSAFVASFLGASNLLAGEIESIDGELAKVRLAAGAIVSVPVDRLSQTSGPVEVGVRPEKLELATEGTDRSHPNVLEGRVVASSYTGISTSYQIETNDGTVLVAYEQNVAGSSARVADGNRVRLAWAPEHTFVVEASSKEA
jgi:spermidine/putrescine transport system ATP-binding protein